MDQFLNVRIVFHNIFVSESKLHPLQEGKIGQVSPSQLSKNYILVARFNEFKYFCNSKSITKSPTRKPELFLMS